MKMSEVNEAVLANYLKLPRGSYIEPELLMILDAAQSYVESYTGLPLQSSDGSACLDDYPDATMAFLIICQELYDHRTADDGGGSYKTSGVNNTLDTILGMHRRNLV